MLTGLKLGNFKAFAETQDIPIRPITLIFGANSSGKSSIIHSLLLANHACETGNLDVHRTRLGGESVDLGGFRQYAHNHEANRQVVFGLTMPFRGIDLFTDDNSLAANYTIGACDRMGGIDDSSPVVLDFSLESNATPFLSVKRNDAGQLVLDKIDLFIHWFGERKGFLIAPNFQKPEHEQKYREFLSALAFEIKGFIPVPTIDANKRALFKLLRYSEQIKEEVSAVMHETLGRPYGEKERYQYDLRYFMDILMEQLGSDIGNLLRNLRYLGPLRLNPPRHLIEMDDQHPNWQSGGGQAWYRLKMDSALLSAANAGIAHLQMPYELRVRDLVDRQNPADTVLVELSLLDKRANIPVSHRDVGIGVSQIIPVIAMLFSSKHEIIAVEQPEIHLHPAAQADLGDLIIQSALGANRNTLLLETHSEHLILRILRRVRETTEGQVPSGAIPIHPEDVSVVFVEPTPQGSVVHQLPVTPDGDFGVPWPGGFFAERFQDLP